MARATGIRKVLLEQLAAELGVPVTGEDGVVEANVDQATLDTAIAAHVPDGNWNAPPEDKFVYQLRAKCQAVYNQTDTFTSTQAQRLLAAVVLRLTR